MLLKSCKICSFHRPLSTFVPLLYNCLAPQPCMYHLPWGAHRCHGQTLNNMFRKGFDTHGASHIWAWSLSSARAGEEVRCFAGRVDVWRPGSPSDDPASAVWGEAFPCERKRILTLLLALGFPICNMGANRIKILRHCSLTRIFSSGRQWTPSGRPVDASVDAHWTVRQILACDTNPTTHHHN